GFGVVDGVEVRVAADQDEVLAHLDDDPVVVFGHPEDHGQRDADGEGPVGVLEDGVVRRGHVPPGHLHADHLGGGEGDQGFHGGGDAGILDLVHQLPVDFVANFFEEVHDGVVDEADGVLGGRVVGLGQGSLDEQVALGRQGVNVLILDGDAYLV